MTIRFVNSMDILIPAGNVKLKGKLVLPFECRALVIFAHGSGSSWLSTRNNFVADTLHKKGIGTFLFDLLSEEEAGSPQHCFDIDLLTERLILATRYITALPECADLPAGYFGASTGAASAFRAAAALPELIKTIVSRGGRPDLALSAAREIRVPTLLIVGERDTEVLRLNNLAADEMRTEMALYVVPGATHLFGEPGSLQQVANVALHWFVRHLCKKHKEELILN